MFYAFQFFIKEKSLVVVNHFMPPTSKKNANSTVQLVTIYQKTFGAYNKQDKENLAFLK
jgi:hypothetical protein